MKKKELTKPVEWQLLGCRVCFAVPLQDCFGRGSAFPHQCRIADARGRELCIQREGMLAEERKIWAQLSRQMERLPSDYVEYVSWRAQNWRREREKHQAECSKCREDAKNWRPVEYRIPRFPMAANPKSQMPPRNSHRSRRA